MDGRVLLPECLADRGDGIAEVEAGGVGGGGGGTDVSTLGVGKCVAVCQESSVSTFGIFFGNQRSQTWT